MHPINKLLAPFGFKISRPSGRFQLNRTSIVPLDYPINPINRWPHGKPNQIMEALLSEGISEYTSSLVGLRAAFKIAKIQNDEPADSPQPRWKNDFISPLDALSLMWAIMTKRPKTYLEIGSGNSTKFVRHAISSLNLQTKIISIDPYPRAEVDRICDKTIRQPFESIDLASLAAVLESGDVVFFDGSHRCFQNSDATVFFNEFIWMLPPGVLVGIHDIFLPYDYPVAWLQRYYSEQYLLGALLIADNGRKFSIKLPCNFCYETGLAERNLGEVKSQIGVNAELGGGAFWMEVNSQ